jgi:hypothetical protein
MTVINSVLLTSHRMSHTQEIFVLDRAQASEVGDGGATLRAKLSPPLQLQKHKRHTVYLDQLSAVNSFNNVSAALENDTIALVRLDPTQWVYHARTTQSFTLEDTYGGVASASVAAGDGTLEDLLTAINGDLYPYSLSVVPASDGNHTWTLQDDKGGDMTPYMSPTPAQLNSTYVTIYSKPDPGDIITKTVPRGNYDLDSLEAAINDITVPGTNSFGVTLTLNDSTQRLKVTPAATNTMTVIWSQSSLFTSMLGFDASGTTYLQANGSYATVPGIVTAPSVENTGTAQFDAFSTIQVHTPLARSNGPSGKPDTAIAQTLVDVAAGRAFNYHPPRSLEVPAAPGFSTDTIQVSLRTPSGKFVDTDENWSAVLVIRTYD